MRALKSGSWSSSKIKHMLVDRGTCRPNMKQLPFMAFICIVMLYIVYRTTQYQYHQTEMETRTFPFSTSQESDVNQESDVKQESDVNRESDVNSRRSLPRGIIQSHSDYKLKPLWSRSKLQDDIGVQNLLAMPVGIKQKHNVDNIVQKFLPENFAILLFHYDGNVDGWWDFKWSKDAIHIVALNQTKWWFAKRFLHPSIVYSYDYIFLWDEDLGVEHFDPGRYLDIVRSEGLEISQPALDPNSTGIHHRITIRRRTNVFHRRVWETRGSNRCSRTSEGPPCSGFVEGMAPVFSRSAWDCSWHLIQNDLVHGWGMDMKLGYCAQGQRSIKVGVVDSQYLVHQSIQTLGGPSLPDSHSKVPTKNRGIDVRAEIRRRSTYELEVFEERWEKAVKEDKNWVDPYRNSRKPMPRPPRTPRTTRRKNLRKKKRSIR